MTNLHTSDRLIASAPRNASATKRSAHGGNAQ